VNLATFVGEREKERGGGWQRSVETNYCPVRRFRFGEGGEKKKEKKEECQRLTRPSRNSYVKPAQTVRRGRRGERKKRRENYLLTGKV